MSWDALKVVAICGLIVEVRFGCYHLLLVG